MRSSCCGLWRTGRLRARLRFEQPCYSAGDTAVLLLDAHNKSGTDVAEVVVSPDRRDEMSSVHPRLIVRGSIHHHRLELDSCLADRLHLLDETKSCQATECFSLRI